MRFHRWARTALLASISRPVCGFGTAGRMVHSVVAVSKFQATTSPLLTTTVTFHHSTTTFHHHAEQTTTTRLLTRRMQSNSGDNGMTLTHIGREEMEEILEDVENGGREESGYVVMDVRNSDELAMTGTLGKNTFHLPLPLIMEKNVFTMDEDDFLEVCGFEKPELDETLVFSCAAGIRSVYAAQFAAKAGYTNLVNYKGGANEWFRR